MKKYLILFLISLTLGCQKEKDKPTPINPPDPGPDPIGEVYNISVTSGDHGSISPQNTTLKLGDNISYVITPNSGYNIQRIVIDNVVIDSMISGSFSYSFNKVNSDHSINVTFTDSLTSNQLDSMNHLLVGKWYTKRFEYKISDTIFHDPWHDFTMPPCEVDDYSTYYAGPGFTYQDSQNGTFCSGNNTDILETGTWGLYPQGKSYFRVHGEVKDSVLIAKLTRDSLITIFVIGQNAYKAYNVH